MSIPTPKPDSEKSRKIVIGGLIAFFALLAFAVVFVVSSFQGTRRDAEPVAENFLAAIEKRDYVSARRLLTPAARNVTSEEQITDVIAILEKRRGKMTGHGDSVNFFAGIDKETKYAKATYTQSYQNGSGRVTVVLIPDDGEWRVHSFNYQL